MKTTLGSWSDLFWQVFHLKLSLSLHLPGEQIQTKTCFPKKKKLSMSKTFVLLLQRAKREEVLSTCFKMLLMQPVCYESVGQAVTWSPLSIGCCLPMPWFSFYAPAHWPLSANIGDSGSSQLPFCKQTHTCITWFSEERYLLSHFVKSAWSEKKSDFGALIQINRVTWPLVSVYLDKMVFFTMRWGFCQVFSSVNKVY